MPRRLIAKIIRVAAIANAFWTLKLQVAAPFLMQKTKKKGKMQHVRGKR